MVAGHKRMKKLDSISTLSLCRFSWVGTNPIQGQELVLSSYPPDNIGNLGPNSPRRVWMVSNIKFLRQRAKVNDRKILAYPLGSYTAAPRSKKTFVFIFQVRRLSRLSLIFSAYRLEKSYLNTSHLKFGKLTVRTRKL